jgi:toxin CcdB
MMAQFDVYANPLLTARHAYPFVVAMQSDITDFANEQIVAPLAPKVALPAIAGRLAPTVLVDKLEHVVLIPRLTTIRSRDLGHSVASIASSRLDLLAATDYLFFGV